jgi:chromosome partitioning protein
LRRIELVTSDDVKAQVHDRLATWMALEDVQSSFDIAVLDTAPSKGPLAVAAMRSATHILLPSEMETQSVEGLRGMLALWRKENRARATKIKIIGILPNKFRRQTNLQAGIFQSLREDETLGPLMAPCSLGLRSSFAEADHPDAVPKSIFNLPVSSEARQEAEAVMEWVEMRMRQ